MRAQDSRDNESAFWAEYVGDFGKKTEGDVVLATALAVQVLSGRISARNFTYR